MVRCVTSHAAYFLILVLPRLLAVPPIDMDFGSAPLRFCLEGGIPSTDGDIALVLFRGTYGGQERKMQ